MVIAIKNETLVAENVEIDMETLALAQFPCWQQLRRDHARVKVAQAVIDALSPEDRKKLEAYREQ